MPEYYYSGKTDIGCGRTTNEDDINVLQLSNDVVFAVLADGMGSVPSGLQPANIVCTDVCTAVREMYESEDLRASFLDNAEVVLKNIVCNANRVLGAFKKANEELYSGFGSTLTCCLLDDQYRFTLVHTGNSRLYLIRKNKNDVVQLRQLTTDHTRVKELYDLGTITEEEMYTHPERCTLTSALGYVAVPTIQTMTAKVKPKDILFLTTDGIHYAVRPEAMLEIIQKSETVPASTENIIYAAKSLKYNDNMSAITIYVT